MSGWGEVSKALEGCGKIGDSCNHKIVGAGIRHEDAVGEPLDGISDTRCGGGCDVNVITSVVLKSRSDIIAGDTMRSPGSPRRWFIVNEDLDASRGDGVGAKIMSTAMNTCISGDGWIDRVRYKVIKAELHLREKHVPQRERESRIHCAKRRNGVILERLDAAFCAICTVLSRGAVLYRNIFSFEESLERGRCLIV